MQKRILMTTTALACTAAAAFASDPDAQTKSATDPGAAASPIPVTPSPPPIVRVHAGSASDDRDARVPLANGMKISMPPSAGRIAGTPDAAPSGNVRPDGAIEIPDNTLGPGEALWQRNERIDAENRQARAEADHAQRIAEGPLYDEYFVGWSGGYPVYASSPRWRWRAPWRSHAAHLPAEPVFDDLGAKAQREFSNAAYPRLSAIEQGRANAVIEFGKAATPRIAPIQNAVDQAQINARKDLFSTPDPTRKNPPSPAPRPRPRPTPDRTR